MSKLRSRGTAEAVRQRQIELEINELEHQVSEQKCSLYHDRIARMRGSAVFTQKELNARIAITDKAESDLRQQLDKKRMELAWIETEIMSVKSQYDRENIDLFEEMFGEKNTLWDHLDRMSDTPIAEEVYGG